MTPRAEDSWGGDPGVKDTLQPRDSLGSQGPFRFEGQQTNGIAQCWAYNVSAPEIKTSTGRPALMHKSPYSVNFLASTTCLFVFLSCTAQEEIPLKGV